MFAPTSTKVSPRLRSPRIVASASRSRPGRHEYRSSVARLTKNRNCLPQNSTRAVPSTKARGATWADGQKRYQSRSRTADARIPTRIRKEPFVRAPIDRQTSARPYIRPTRGANVIGPAVEGPTRRFRLSERRFFADREAFERTLGPPPQQRRGDRGLRWPHPAFGRRRES